MEGGRAIVHAEPPDAGVAFVLKELVERIATVKKNSLGLFKKEVIDLFYSPSGLMRTEQTHLSEIVVWRN